MNCLSLSVSLLSFLVLGLPRLLGTGPCCSEGKEAKSAKDVHVSKLIGYHHLYTLYRNNNIYIYIQLYVYIHTYTCVLLLFLRLSEMVIIIVIVIIVIYLTIVIAMHNCICI